MADLNGHSHLRTGPTFTVEQLGIKDIDGYGHVWYGNYLKFFARGLVAFLGGGTVRRVEHLKYKRSVPWGADSSRIESYLVSRPAPNTALVYQRWCVGDEADNTNALCLSLVELPPGVGDAVPVMAGSERLPRNGPKLAMAVKNLQTGAVRSPAPSPAAAGQPQRAPPPPPPDHPCRLLPTPRRPNHQTGCRLACCACRATSLPTWSARAVPPGRAAGTAARAPSAATSSSST